MGSDVSESGGCCDTRQCWKVLPCDDYISSAVFDSGLNISEVETVLDGLQPVLAAIGIRTAKLAPFCRGSVVPPL
jgi:hypothetical protein